MRRLAFLLVIIFLVSCGSAAPTAAPTNTPTGGPKLVTPPSAKQYSGGEERIDFYVDGMKGTDIGQIKRQDFYLVTEPMIEVYRFYRNEYKTNTIDDVAPQPNDTNFVMFIKAFGSGREYTILISYLDLGTINREDGLLAVTVIQ